YRGSGQPIPVEVKWSEDYLMEHQLDYLEKKNGFIMSFVSREIIWETIRKKFPTKKYSNIQYSELNIEDFREWMRRRHQALIDDHFRASEVSGSPSKNWILSLRAKPGTGGEKRAVDNMKNMLKDSKSKMKRFWALNNRYPRSIENALAMHEGDRIIFLFYRLRPSNPSERYKIKHPPLSDSKINIHGYILGKITHGHHFVLEQDDPAVKEEFFEGRSIKVGDRKWPH
ncbi:uncharacterized protein METZ01_LOCUS517518, partial [marine metagenome]